MPLKVQFYDSALGGELNERSDAPDASASVSEVARRDLQRYYELLALALASVTLSVGEASLIVDALNGTYVDIHAAQGLHYEIADALDDGLAAKWRVDGPALVATVSGWTLLQRMAVCDAVERVWGNTYHVDNIEQRLVRVGLVRAAVP